MEKLKKIDTKTIRQKVYDQLRQKIITGDIQPGQSITLRNLAEEFGVSLMPVREAIYQLESEDVIVIESNKSISVNRLSAEEMEEVLELRLILESIAAERSCERRPDSVLQTLERILKNMANSTHQHKKYLLYNAEFHFILYSYANSPVLLKLIDYLWTRVGPYLFILLRKKDLSETQESHNEMFEAFVSKDKKKLIEGLQKDLKIGAKFIMPHLKKSAL